MDLYCPITIWGPHLQEKISKVLDKGRIERYTRDVGGRHTNRVDSRGNRRILVRRKGIRIMGKNHEEQQGGAALVEAAREEFGPNNLNIDVEDGILTLKIDLERVIGQTTSNNDRIASTFGQQVIDSQGTRVGLNVYRKTATLKTTQDIDGE